MRFEGVSEINEVMTSLHDLLARKDKLLSLLESSSKEARATIQALLAAHRNPTDAAAAEDLMYRRVVDRRLTEQIHGEVHQTSLEALDCEGLEKLADVLYKIPKLANKFQERLLGSPEFAQRVDFSGQLKCLQEASDLLVSLVSMLQARLEPERVAALCERMQSIEREADQQMLRLYQELYGGSYTDRAGAGAEGPVRVAGEAR